MSEVEIATEEVELIKAMDKIIEHIQNALWCECDLHDKARKFPDRLTGTFFEADEIADDKNRDYAFDDQAGDL